MHSLLEIFNKFNVERASSIRDLTIFRCFPSMFHYFKTTADGLCFSKLQEQEMVDSRRLLEKGKEFSVCVLSTLIDAAFPKFQLVTFNGGVNPFDLPETNGHEENRKLRKS
ncbi:hypothetical protein NPIL_470501 [Nephila pilipes]|uniref:Uncharacterized protein n=1 Tax=Nephila pilipes TaxID=299642 RepID=A0A8X6JWX9_NEPPI|nr:hypothetical protein NPIL_470501 [Nephila pilipes]